MQLLKLLKRQESPLELADLPLPPLPSLPSIEGKIDGKLCSDELDFGLPPLPDEIEERKSPARALPPRPVLGLPPLPPPPKPSKGKSTTCLPEFSAPFPKRENVKPMPRPPLPSFSLPPLPPPPAEAPRPVAPFPKLAIPPTISLPRRGTEKEPESCMVSFPEIPTLFRKPHLEPGQEAPAVLPDLELPSLPPLPPRPAPFQQPMSIRQEQQSRPTRPSPAVCLPPRGVMFIRAEEYSGIQSYLHEARQSIKQAGSSLDRINAIKNREDTDIDALKTCLETIQRKLGYVDKSIFECKE